MKGYDIIDIIKVEDHITFIRINPTDIKLTLSEVFASLSDLSWINQFDKDYIKDSFKKKAEDSLNYISDKIIKSGDDKITQHSGEYVISELARKAIIDNLFYLDVPLAELFKIKDVGNHGFDFYSENKNEVILFGEAKYNSRQNAYGNSFEQIFRFVNEEKQDLSDITDIDKFFKEKSLDNFHNGKKGFIAAFASKGTSTKKILKGLKVNKHFLELKKFEEIICVAVNI
jgi:hypothetical protein